MRRRRPDSASRFRDPGDRAAHTVVLYGRAECHLCEQARAAILSIREQGFSFALREVDIDSDERLHATYLERIPVVELDGAIVSELRLDPDVLRASLDTVRA